MTSWFYVSGWKYESDNLWCDLFRSLEKKKNYHVQHSSNFEIQLWSLLSYKFPLKSFISDIDRRSRIHAMIFDLYKWFNISTAKLHVVRTLWLLSDSLIFIHSNNNKTMRVKGCSDMLNRLQNVKCAKFIRVLFCSSYCPHWSHQILLVNWRTSDSL